APVRATLLDRAELVEVWSSDELLFDASVRVCAPVLVRRDDDAGATTPATTADATRTPTSTVAVRWGGGAAGAAAQVRRASTPKGPESWGPLFAAARGVPAGVPHGGPRLGTVATATAGFRDEFYALSAAAVEQADIAEEHIGADPASLDPVALGAVALGAVALGAVAPRLVTVGMIDPGRCTWGEQPRRIGGRTFTAPRLDVAALAADAPRIARWADARRVPKVLVATQTRVVEAVADPEGTAVPVTPTISVEPGPDGETDVWHLCAALLAPPVAARAAAMHLGAGLSPGALRWSARQVLDVELPIDPDAWTEGAELVRALHTTAPAESALRRELLHRLGRTMCAAHDRDGDDELFEWWASLADRAVR
ncbi:MAG: hypothetical protein ACYC2O_12285, partial [Microthrixaceae bacterium]